MADDTKPADTQQAQQPAAAGAAPDDFSSSLSATGVSGQDASAPPPKPPSPPPEHEGPKDWAEMKAWIRREIELVGQGHTHEEREAANP